MSVITTKIIACESKNLGMLGWQDAYQIQQTYVNRLLNGGKQALLFCEHPRVLTLGRLAKEENLLFSQRNIEAQGYEVHPIDRGGDVTLHAPGQMVVYPIFDLRNYKKDLHFYLNQLEQVIIDLLADFDTLARRFKGQTGVWVGDDKIASIGIGVKKWISFHGLALNVNTDLNAFSVIRPCGLDVKMTSMEKILGNKIDLLRVENTFLEKFERNFNLKI